MSPLLGIIGIVGSLYFVFTYPAQGFQGYLDIPSMVLLVVTPPCVLLLSHNILDFLTGIGSLLSSLVNRQHRSQMEVISFLTKASALVRSDGIGSLLQVRNQINYELLRDGVSLIINDFSTDEIRHNLTAKINTKQTRMSLASNLFENMSKVCPGIGMIGTLLGLIGMLANMADPSKLGSGMALAMITTLYGIMLGTLLYAPAGERIALNAERDLEIDQMVLEGVLSLKGKKSSVHLKDIMKTYVGKNADRGNNKKGGEGPPRRRGR